MIIIGPLDWSWLMAWAMDFMGPNWLLLWNHLPRARPGSAKRVGLLIVLTEIIQR